MENIINVEGIECAGCENRIQNAIKVIPNVIEVVASHTAGTVKVVGDVDLEVIKDKINDLGFEVKE